MKSKHALKMFTLAGTAAAALFGTAQTTGFAATGYPGTNQNGFTAPVAIPTSDGFGEPTIIHDSGAGNGANGNVNRLFVTAPQKIGTVNSAGGSPMWTSLNGGATWSAAVRSQMCAVLSGGDTDLVADGADNVYQTDLWLGNACMSVSTNHGQTFAAGDPYGSNQQPGDDRQWLAWNKKSNQNYITWDGLDGLHVGNTLPLSNPLTGIQIVQDVVAEPECAVSTCSADPSLRVCVCPPGGIAVDNSAGTTPHQHPGRIYIAYSHQSGQAISYTDLVGTCPACTASPSWTGPIIVPGTGGSGSAFQNEYNMSPIHVDSNGTVYTVWAHGVGFNATTRLATSVQIQYAYSVNGGVTWSLPVTLSTLGGTTVFPTFDVVSPGVIDVAWYGDPAHAQDPNLAPGPWNLYYTRVTAADTQTPVYAPEIAVSGMHTGCIQSSGVASCTDRSLLDFFQLTNSDCGNANIIYTGGDVTNSTKLYFTKLAGTCAGGGPGTNVPDTPWVPLLMLPGAAAIGVAIRRRRGQAPPVQVA